jgi:hypothetical protein
VVGVGASFAAVATFWRKPLRALVKPKRPMRAQLSYRWPRASADRPEMVTTPPKPRLKSAAARASTVAARRSRSNRGAHLMTGNRLGHICARIAVAIAMTFILAIVSGRFDTLVVAKKYESVLNVR